MAGEGYELGTYSKCGHCIQCINEKCNNWVIRNYYEAKQHEKICFITLTYAENPILIVKKDLTDFLKRFRIRLDRTSGEKIRYYGCMEYGTLNGRPHAHLIIYGWKDPNAIYKGINKKKNTFYESQIIKECWGHGITSYQEFNEHEIPYLTLYDTPSEEFTKAYKLTRKKLKEIEEIYRRSANMSAKRRQDLLNGLEHYKKEFDENKAKYKLVKEYQTWSIGLGWEPFFEQYSKKDNYAWQEYIEDKEFCTPSPWVKRLANMGIVEAAEEMRAREKLIGQTLSEDQERLKNIIKVMGERKKDILDWKTQKTETEITL